MKKSKLKIYYKNLSYIIMSTLLLIIALDILSYFAILIYRYKKSDLPEVLAKYGIDNYINLNIYGDKNRDQILQIWKDVDKLSLEIEPFTMFREKVGFTSKTINIAQEGYRISSNQKLLDTQIKKVFLIGGSTTFGYGVRDSETIASFLQKQLGDSFAVFNFGRGHYYSRQELVLFINLLLQEQKPDILISIDGINERRIKFPPSYSYSYRSMGAQDINNIAYKLFIDRPLVKILTFIQEKTIRHNSNNVPLRETPQSWAKDYLNSIQLIETIAKSRGITYFAFLQPAPWFQHPHKSTHPFTDNPNREEEVLSYNEISTSIGFKQGPEYLYNISKLAEDENRPLYVDKIHYNPYFSKKIAKKIAKIITQSK